MTRSTLLYTLGGFVAGMAVTLALNSARVAREERKRARSSAKKDAAEDFVRSRDLLLSSTTGTAPHRVSFLTEIAAQLWDYINVAGSNTIRATLEPMLEGITPAIHVKKMDLGKIPIKLDNIVVHKIQDGSVKFDMDVVWDGECDIQLKAKFLGSFGVKSVKLKGRMSFLLKPLINDLPVASAIQYAFINPPQIKLDFTGLAEIADFKVIHNQIHQVISDSLNSMVVLPNQLLYEMITPTVYMEAYQPPIGIARITCVKGFGFVVERKSFGADDVPDVYCNITLGASTTWRTDTVRDRLSPEWDNEYRDFLLSDHAQVITLEAWDEDRAPLDSDDYLGRAQISVGELLLKGRMMNLELQTDEGLGTGAFVTLHCNVSKWTPDLTSLQCKEEPNVMCGLVTIIVLQAFDIPLERKEAAAFVKASFGGTDFYTSAVTDYPGYDALNPTYNYAFQVPLTPAMASAKHSIDFALMNGVDVLGTTTLTWDSLTVSPGKMIKVKRPVGSASLEFCVLLRGIQDGSRSRSAPNVSMPATDLPSKMAPKVIEKEIPEEKPAIGTVRIKVIKGRGFKVQKRRFRKDDIPDIYCLIRFGKEEKLWRTSTVRNSVEPKWNESKEFVLTSHGLEVTVDAFDEDKKTADDHLGSVTIFVSTLLLAGATTEVELESMGRKTGAFLTLGCDMVDPNDLK